MPKTDNVRQVDLPRATSGGATYVRSGSSGRVSNADTVDGYHASSTATAGKLLALDSLSRFPTNIIDWAAVNHNALGSLAVGNPHTQYVNSASGGITKTGQDVALAATVAGDGLALAAGVLSVNVGTGIKITTDAVALDTHTHQTAAQGGTLDHGLALTGLADDDHPQYARVAPPTTARNVIQAGAVDVTPLSLRAFSAAQSAALWKVEDSGGNTLIRVNQAGDLESAGFQSGIRGWRVDHGGTAEFQNAYIRGELHATVFVKDLIEAHAGTLGIFKSGGKLEVDFTTPAVGATAALTITDPPGGGFLFSSGDWVRIKAEHASGVYDVWGQVTLPVDNGDGTQSYTYTHRSGTVGAVIPAGVAVADYGASGQGYILATADLNYAPYLDVASWAGANPYTGSNHTAHVRLGQLRGITGADEWGMWAGGTYAGLTGQRYLKASSAGLTIYGLPQTWVDAAGNVRGAVIPTATGSDTLFWLGPSVNNQLFSVDAQGQIVMGPAGGNLCENSAFEHGSAGWTLVGATIGTATPYYGPNCVHIIGAFTETMYALQTVPVDASTTYTVSAYYCVSAGVEGSTNPLHALYVEERTAANAYITAHTVPTALSGGFGLYRRLATTFTTDATCASLRVYLYVRDCTGSWRWDCVQVQRGEWATPWEPSKRGQVVIDSYRVEAKSSGGARVILGRDGTDFGLVGYGTDGTTRQFYIRASDGRGEFGGGKGILDRTGLMLSGSETALDTFNSVRWLNGTLPSGTEVARLSAGRWRDSAPTMELVVNDPQDATNGHIGLTVKGKVFSTHAANLYLRSWQGSPYGAAAEAQLMTVDDTATCVWTLGQGSIRGMIYTGSTGVERMRLQLGNSASTPTLALGGDTDTGFWQSAANNLDIATGGTNRVNISSSGLTLSGQLILGAGAELQCNSSYAITVTHSAHLVQAYTESLNYLDTISGGTTGSILVLRGSSSGYAPVVRHVGGGTGNIRLIGGANFTLSNYFKAITLTKWGTSWFELCRSDVL